MSEQAEVAPSEATGESIVSQETTSEATENTEGQEDQPAEGQKPEDTPDDKSESAKRRERRKAHEQRLLSEKEQAEREAEGIRKRLDRLKSAYAGETAPKEADFTDPIEYAAASALFKQRQSDIKRESDATEAQATEFDEKAASLEKERQAQLIEALEDQKAEARSRYTDFDAVFNAAHIPQSVAGVLIESEQAAEVAYHLGKHPALARQIAQLPPLAMAREIGRIEAVISRPAPKTQSSAPEPITPVNPKGTASKDPEKMSAAEWRAFREAGGRF